MGEILCLVIIAFAIFIGVYEFITNIWKRVTKPIHTGPTTSGLNCMTTGPMNHAPEGMCRLSAVELEELYKYKTWAIQCNSNLCQLASELGLDHQDYQSYELLWDAVGVEVHNLYYDKNGEDHGSK